MYNSISFNSCKILCRNNTKKCTTAHYFTTAKKCTTAKKYTTAKKCITAKQILHCSPMAEELMGCSTGLFLLLLFSLAFIPHLLPPLLAPHLGSYLHHTYVDSKLNISAYSCPSTFTRSSPWKLPTPHVCRFLN